MRCKNSVAMQSLALRFHYKQLMLYIAKNMANLPLNLSHSMIYDSYIISFYDMLRFIISLNE